MNQRLQKTNRLWLWLMVLLMAPGAAWAQVSFTGSSLTITQDFNTLPTSGSAAFANNTTIPGFFASVSASATPPAAISASAGTSGTGYVYSFGTGINADRSFGAVISGGAFFGSPASGAIGLRYGLLLQNNTGSPITSLAVTYTGEQWRNGGNTSANPLTVDYTTGTGLSVSSATGYTAVAALTFTSPVVGSTAAALDGNAAANRSTLNATITFATPVADGQQILLRWTDLNDVGNDHGLSIDDLMITAMTASPPAPATVTLSIDTDNVTESPTQVVTVTATATAPVTGDQTVNLTPTGSASNGADYALSTPSITILSGQTTGSITLTTLDDALVEGSETATLTISSTSAGLVTGNPAAQTITITDNDVATPTLTANPDNLGGFSTMTGMASAPQVYTLTGSNLTADVTVSAPAGFQVSTDGTTFQDQLTVPVASGTASVTIAVRLTGTTTGSPSGTVTNVSGAASVNVAVSGQVNAQAAVLTATPTTLSGFTATTGTASAPQVYTLTGSNLTANVTVSAPAGFQVSTDGINYLDEVTVNAVSGSVSATVAVQLTGTTPGSFSGTINNVSGTASATVAVSGQVNAPAAASLTVTPTTLSGFSTAQGTASAPQIYTLTGSNLTASVSVSAPAGFQVSTNGTTFQDQLTVAAVSGSVSATIAVRLTGVTAGSLTGNITNVSGSLTATVAVSGQVNAAPSNSLYYDLSVAPFTQNWSNTGLITTNDNWSNVPSIIGYRGDDLTTATGTNPGTIVADGSATPVNVLANQTNPNGVTAGGVAEFEIDNPTIALNGSGTADAPHIVIYLNTSSVSNINVAYNVRDLDGSADNSIQQVALQYRIGTTGNFTNILAAFVTDATAGPNSATQVTAVNVTLPTEAENQSQVQLRIISANAAGNDEWVGIDDIVVSGTVGVPTGSVVSIQASDANAAEAGPDPGVFTITRTGSTTAAITVNYVVGTGTGQATNGTDYTPTLTGTVTLDANQTTATITVTPVDDALIEGNESIVLSLTTGDGYTLSGSRLATVVIADNDVVAGGVRIHDIQGASHRSPLVTQTVTNVPGIVTVLTSNGFYLEDTTPDADPATSEGIFVFTSSAPSVAVGTAVLVSGTVTEFRPGNNNSNLSTTQINSTGISTQSTGNAVPGPTVISSAAGADRIIPTRVISNDFTNGDVESSTFDPAEDGLDFFESLEGMRVQINNPLTTGFRNGNGELFVIADNGNGATGRNSRNTITISGPDQTDINSALINSDFNPERIQIDDVLLGPLSLPNVNVGAVLSTIIGVVSYDFQNYEVLPTVAPTVVTPNPATREVTNLAGTGNQVTIATFNVENLDPGDDPAKFRGLASAIVTNLKSPDIITLEEIQDNNGPGGGGVVDASQTFQTLINAIVTAGGPTYQFRQIDPVNGTNGGEPGGNIRVGFLFNPARVSFVDRPGGGSTTATTVINVNGQPQLSASPGLIDPTNSAFSGSRKPLVGEFTFNGQTIFVIGNHFTSRGGSDSPTARFQPPNQGGQTTREAQAAIVNNFVDQLLAVNTSANVAVMGDINEFQFFPVLQILEGDVAGQQPVLVNLITTLPVEEQYTYNFDGNAQALDHILTSNSLFGKLSGFDVVHINSEFLDQLSDHDPSVSQFNLGTAVTPLALTLTASPDMLLTTGTTTLSATVSGGSTGSPDRPYSYTFSGPGTIAQNGNTATVSNLPAGVQTFTVRVADATSPTSQTISGTVSVTVSTPAPTNTAPTVANTIPPQSATVGQAFSYVIPANTFADADGDALSLSVSGLPMGLSFNGSTSAITGTPSMTGVSTVTVTATDPGSLSVSTSFTLTVNPAGTTPSPTGPFAITSVTTISCSVLNATTGERSVTFSPQYSGTTGQPITFRVVNELAPTTASGPYTLRLYSDNPVISLRASQSGTAGEATFSYNWLAACNGTQPANTAPTVANAIPPQSATVGQQFSFVIPANTFTDTETPNSLVLSVSGLPMGLSFVAPATITGTPSVSGTSTVTVTATDPGSLSVSTTFTLTVNPAGTTPPPTGPFAITSVTTISCTPVADRINLSFNPQYTGVNGQPITFSVVNELAPTTAAGPYTLSLYRDNPVLSLRAVQSGVVTTLSYNWLAACNGTQPANTAPTVANAIPPQSATVGQQFSYVIPASTFTDANGDALSLSVSGLPMGLSFNGSTSAITGTPSMTGVSTVRVTATDPGSLSVSTSFTLTVNPAGTTPSPTGPFAITSVTTVSCSVIDAGRGERSVTFSPQYSGTTGQPITFRVVNELAPTTNPGPYTLRLYTDNPVISLRATQSGTAGEVSFNYNWLAGCGNGARVSAEPVAPLQVRVLGNPVRNAVEVEVTGAEGSALYLMLTDAQGRTLNQHSVKQAARSEKVRLSIDSRAAGVLLLRASTATQSQTIRLLKAN